MTEKKTYNPMSDEFKDECKRLGLTGNQLTVKYKKEGRCIKKDDVYIRNIVPKIRHYNPTNICDNVDEDGNKCEEKLVSGRVRRDYDKDGNWTGKWICKMCRMKEYRKLSNSNSNIIKSLRDRRIGNQNPSSENAKGDNSQELACILYEWEDLNKKYNNYNYPVDCYDSKTGLYHQVKGVFYYSERGFWPFTNFEREFGKKYETMVCFCISKDGKTIERIYKFPENVVKNRYGATIVKNPVRGVQWYKKYRVEDEDELKKANDIWKHIIYDV